MSKLSCIVIMVVAMAAYADTITVPQNQPTIQAAINAASDGDIIELNSNVFRGDGNRDLNFQNKSLTIRPSPGRTGVRIDPQGASAFARRAGSFVGHTKPITFVDLVFEKGFAGMNTSVVPAGEGGAFLIQNSTGIVFRDCVFRENTTRRENGGAVNCLNSQVLFENCQFYDNALVSFDLGYGVHLYARGGAIQLIDSVFYRGGHSSSTSVTSTIRGKGAAFVGGTHLVDRCIFRDMSGLAQGAGMYTNANTTVQNTLFQNNRAFLDFDDLSGGGGGAVNAGGGHASFTNCLFLNNSSSGGEEDEKNEDFFGVGGAMSVRSGATVDVINSTFTGNTVRYENGLPSDWGIFFVRGAGTTLNIRNSIIHNNTGQIVRIHMDGEVNVSYTIIEGGAPGAGNLDADPLLDAAYAPMTGSPAIDAGNNLVFPLGITIDLAGQPRFVDDPATPDTGIGEPPIIDMGAFEYHPAPWECPPDLNDDGVLDVFDVEVMLGLYSAHDLGADFNGDGILDFFDILRYLQMFSDGCP
ncbi:MAG: hypothetical protein KF757_01480 [Phycisphaeraceae bacterium]|nr:hypothetical protein [Phycisphaeraceae bacterium]MCW5761881.1 hypothetical protein [Phycisphaeraceae bacterium]